MFTLSSDPVSMITRFNSTMTACVRSFAPSHIVRGETFTVRRVEKALDVRGMDVFPAEEPRIDGPGARSHHCQTRAQDRQDDRNPLIAGVGESDPQLSDGYQTSRQWGPQAHKKENPRGGTDDLRRGERNLWPCAKVCNPAMKQRGAGKEALEQQTSARPTIRKSRE